MLRIALVVLVLGSAGCASWEEIKANLWSDDVKKGAGDAAEDFLSGNWVGGISSTIGIIAVIFFRKGVGKGIAATARGAASVYRAARGLEGAVDPAPDPAQPPPSPGGAPLSP